MPTSSASAGPEPTRAAETRRPATDDARRRPATDEEARVIGSALRLRILRLCLYDELSNKQIAQRLDRDPASVLHHVRRLVDTGFLEAQPARRGARGAREVPYRATGKSWSVEVGQPPHGESVRAVLLEAFLAELADAGGGAALQYVTRLGLRLRQQDRDELDDRLAAVFEEFKARAPAADGEPWSLFFAMHPDSQGRPPG